MKLRRRIALVTFATTAPMVGGLVWLDVRAQQTAAETELAELVLTRTELAGERERCIADGQAWDEAPSAGRRREHSLSERRREGPALDAGEGRRSQRLGPAGPHRSPARFFVYDAALRGRTRGAPELPPGAAQEPQFAISRSSIWHGDRVEVLVRTPWPATPCAFVLARGTTEPWLGALLPPTRIWALPALIVFATVLLSIGPIVQRLRRLTQAVQRTAAVGYEQPLEASAARTRWGDDEIAELGRAFDHAGEEVRKLLAEKDQRERALRDFVADTTHDVAIPLTVLQGHLTTLRDELASGAPADRVALASAMDEAHYIGALLHNLGAAAKLDAEELSLQRGDVELGALVTRVVGRHRPIAQQHAVSIDAAIPEHPVLARADVTLLEQAVSNVVYNAVRHNRPHGHVAVLLLELPSAASRPGAEPSKPRFCIRVLDDGPGVAPELLAHLAERGVRSERARSRSPEGRGLGLHITQRVLDAHGMQLRLSTPEQGGLQVEIEGDCS
jgi:two-component system sensor histidine kinase BaeS